MSECSFHTGGGSGAGGAGVAGAVAVEVGRLVGVDTLDVHLVGLGGLPELGHDETPAPLGRRIHLKYLEKEGHEMRRGPPRWHSVYLQVHMPTCLEAQLLGAGVDGGRLSHTGRPGDEQRVAQRVVHVQRVLIGTVPVRVWTQSGTRSEQPGHEARTKEASRF